MDFNTWSQSRVHNSSSSHSTSSNDINAKVESYSHLNNEEMLQALYRTVNDEKAKGIFDINNIWSFYRNISPMLDSDSRTRLHDIIEAIELN